jgi:hypothetical protein
MCEVCRSLNQKIAAAVTSHDRERERVMRVLLANHERDAHVGRVVVSGTDKMPAWVLATEAER